MSAAEIVYDPYDYAIDADPSPIFKRMRDEAPVYYNEQYGFYALSRFDDVLAGSLDHETFSSNRGSGNNAIYRKAADGSGEVELVVEPGELPALYPTSWSSDGKSLAVWTSNSDIYVANVENGEIEPFQTTDFGEFNPTFSPDGRWIAYDSNETGRLEIYVRAFPASGGKWQVSDGGGALVGLAGQQAAGDNDLVGHIVGDVGGRDRRVGGFGGQDDIAGDLSADAQDALDERARCFDRHAFVWLDVDDRAVDIGLHIHRLRHGADEDLTCDG